MAFLQVPMPLPLRRSGFANELFEYPATVPTLLAARSADSEDLFLVGPDFRLTFAEADAQSAVLAARLLASGIGKGTRVGVLFPNGAQWAIAWLAAARIGALTVPLSTFAPSGELARALRYTDVHAVLTGPRFGEEDLARRLEDALPALGESSPQLELVAAPFLRWISVHGDNAPAWSRELPAPVSEAILHAAESEVTPADALAIISTSGATAAPKAVVHTHGSLVRHAALLADRRGLTREDRIYSPMPFFWVGGLTMVLLAAMSSGAAGVVQERFEAGEALGLAERERATQISCWPNAARAMAEHPTFSARDLSSVRGGTLVEALAPDQRPPSPDRAPMPLGMTETGGPHTGTVDPYSPLPEELRGTFGQSLPGVEHCIVDPDTGAEIARTDFGELYVRGPFVMQGLYKRERHESFTADGWYPTGDLGCFDYEGNLTFGGRRTTMIKTAGSNVSPGEVEDVLRSIDGVRAAFVFGIPAGVRGEDVAAVVALAPGATLGETVLKAQARRELASYKVPRRWKVVREDALPMLPTGKVDLAAMRSLVGTDPA